MLSEEFEVERTKDGAKVKVPIFVCFDEMTSTLAIFTQYRPTKGKWADTAYYRVEEIPTDVPGRAFLLHRSQCDIDADPNKIKRYACLVASTREKSLCECRGLNAHGVCKHEDALRWVVDQTSKAPPACDKCGATDCDLVLGVCRDCVDAEPEAPDFLEPATAKSPDEMSFAEWALS